MHYDKTGIRTKAHFNDSITLREKINHKVAFRAALEGIVLLENHESLPVKPGKIALYGAGARHTIKGGTGSGEVNERCSITIEEGLTAQGFTITTKSWLDNYDTEFNQGLNGYREQVKKIILTMNSSELINIMAHPYRYPFGEIINKDDIKNSGTDTCLFVIARQAGEGSDRRIENHDISLSPQEFKNIKICAESYKNTIVVINAGSYFDTSFFDEIKGITGLINMGKLGSMGGSALAEILSGKSSPSGKLSDSWAKSYDDIPFAKEYSYLNGNLEEEDYREGIYLGYRYFDSFNIKPRYPFGFGLSYTTFSIKTDNISLENTTLIMDITIRNTGNLFSGKEVVQLYVSCPQKDLPKEYQRLAGFAKTEEIPPGESVTIKLKVEMSTLGSYDEENSSYILTDGDYILRVGNSSRKTSICGSVNLDQKVIITKHMPICPVKHPVNEITPPEIKYKDDLDNLPRLTIEAKRFKTHEYQYKNFTEDSDETIEKLVDNLSIKQQIETVKGTGLFKMMFGGDYFSCPGAVGNTTSSLIDKGIPNITFADGPAGLRLQRRSTLKRNGRIKMIDAHIDVFNYFPRLLKKFIFGNIKKDRILYQYTTAFPVEISLAQSWNTDLLEEMGQAISHEMSEYGVSFWLGPGLNIHRNPLCGRNYEYYSEDPLLGGKLAGAVARGCQSIDGNYATLKHYVANNQEENRNQVSSNINERALREIYLKGFQIALEESDATGIMTSYNRLNGVFTANSHDLCTKVLRNEWGFSGVVMTDWLATGKDRADEGLCLRSGNDLIMPGGFMIKRTLLRKLRKKVYSRSDLRRSSIRVLNAVKNSKLGMELSETLNV